MFDGVFLLFIQIYIADFSNFVYKSIFFDEVAYDRFWSTFVTMDAFA
jgi:hypothetical protein